MARHLFNQQFFGHVAVEQVAVVAQMFSDTRFTDDDGSVLYRWLPALQRYGCLREGQPRLDTHFSPLFFASGIPAEAVVELADGATDMNVVLVGHTDACDDQKAARAA